MIQMPPYDDGTERQPWYDYTITLEDVMYRVELKYKDRLGRWYLYLYDADDNALLLGKKLSVNVDLLAQYEIDGLPPGGIVLWDSSGAEAECGYDDLGVRCVLLYLTEAEAAPVATDPDITIEAAP